MCDSIAKDTPRPPFGVRVPVSRAQVNPMKDRQPRKSFPSGVVSQSRLKYAQHGVFYRQPHDIYIINNMQDENVMIAQA